MSCSRLWRRLGYCYNVASTANPMPGKTLRLIVLLSLYLLAILGGGIGLVVLGFHKYQATATPSLTPLSFAQRLEQMQAVSAYNRDDLASALPVFTRLAALGDARSETDLGVMYNCGCGVPQDVDKAFALQAQAAAQHYGKAEDNLGSMYAARGDEISATHWYWLAASHGDANGEMDFGWQLRNGYGVPRDDAQAVHWFSLSAAQGDMIGERWLGDSYEIGRGVGLDHAHALQIFQAAAAQGESASMCEMGAMYEDGDGVERDYAAAMRWYRRAADEGNDCGYTGVGFLYDLGLGVPQSETTALEWYEVAGKDGDATGENDVGAMYHRGAGGVKQDFVQAAYWFGLAANQDDAYGEMNLATLYINGQGVPHNDVIAFTLDQKAANQDEPHAEEQLGNAYRLGYATKIDYAQAAKYYSQAAGHGLAKSQAALAYLYETGQGVPQDDEQAYKWYLISQFVTAHPVMEDDERCKAFAALPALKPTDIKSHLTQSQMVQAQAGADAWAAGHRPLHDSPPPPRRPVWLLYVLSVIFSTLLLAIRLWRHLAKNKHVNSDDS